VTRIPRSLLDRVDLASALASELAFSSDLLPKQVSDRAAATDADAHQDVIRQTLITDDIATEAPVVTAQKSRFGRRPVAGLTLAQRVVYRGVVHLLDEWLVPARGQGDYGSFQDGPVGSDARFVVITDLAHYYATLPVPALQRELMSRSGEWQSVQWLGEFLMGLSPQSGGLPQGNSSSDRIADTYADALARRLRRRGIDCWRYADDFRLAAMTYSQAIDALEVFSDEARKFGLLVNDSKTWITSMSQYKSRLESPRKAFTEAWQSKRDALALVNPYDWSEVPPEDAEVLKSVAIDELESWASVADSLKTNQTDRREERLDLALVMSVLTSVKAEEAIAHVPTLLVVEPQLTSWIARYLTSVMEDHEDGVLDVVASAVSESALTAWQAIWLTDLLSFDLGESPSASALKEWTLQKFLGGREILQAYAGWGSAAQGQMSSAQWRDWSLGSLNAFGQSFVEAALGIIELDAADGKSSRAVGDDLMIQWGKKQHPNVPF
jgi:hypothetical protein